MGALLGSLREITRNSRMARRRLSGRASVRLLEKWHTQGRHLSAAHKAAVSAGLKAYFASKGHAAPKAHIAGAGTGFGEPAKPKTLSDEHKAKVSAGVKAALAKKKAAESAAQAKILIDAEEPSLFSQFKAALEPKAPLQGPPVPKAEAPKAPMQGPHLPMAGEEQAQSKTLSAEHKAAVSAGVKAYFAKKKAEKEAAAGHTTGEADPQKAVAATAVQSNAQTDATAHATHGFPSSPQALTSVKSLGGSTGAMLAEDANGQKFVVKHGNSVEHIQAEHGANEVYRAGGAEAPEGKLYDGNTQVTKYLEGGKELGSLHGTEREAANAQLQKHFVLDAVMGNWDVIGMNADNVLVTPDGKVHRVDNGGSFDFKAQGGKKPYTSSVEELASMRNPVINPQAAKVFGNMTTQEVLDQSVKLYAHKAALVAAAPEQYKKVLGERIDDALARATAAHAEHQASITPPVSTPTEPANPYHSASIKNIEISTTSKVKTAPSWDNQAEVVSQKTAPILDVKTNKVLQTYGYKHLGNDAGGNGVYQQAATGDVVKVGMAGSVAYHGKANVTYGPNASPTVSPPAAKVLGRGGNSAAPLPATPEPTPAVPAHLTPGSQVVHSFYGPVTVVGPGSTPDTTHVKYADGSSFNVNSSGLSPAPSAEPAPTKAKVGYEGHEAGVGDHVQTANGNIYHIDAIHPNGNVHITMTKSGVGNAPGKVYEDFPMHSSTGAHLVAGPNGDGPTEHPFTAKVFSANSAAAKAQHEKMTAEGRQYFGQVNAGEHLGQHVYSDSKGNITLSGAKGVQKMGKNGTTDNFVPKKAPVVPVPTPPSAPHIEPGAPVLSDYGAATKAGYKSEGSKTRAEAYQYAGSFVNGGTATKPPSAESAASHGIEPDHPILSPSFHQKWNEAMAALPPNEKSIVSAFTGSSSGSMNNHLINGGAPNQKTRALDSALSHHTTDRNLITYRGVTWSGFSAADHPPGSIINNPNFSSSTINKEREFGGNVRYRIEIPKGTSGAWVKSVSSVSGEDEWIIPRGAQFQVKSITKEGSSSRVDVRLVGFKDVTAGHGLVVADQHMSVPRGLTTPEHVPDVKPYAKTTPVYTAPANEITSTAQAMKVKVGDRLATNNGYDYQVTQPPDAGGMLKAKGKGQNGIEQTFHAYDLVGLTHTPVTMKSSSGGKASKAPAASAGPGVKLGEHNYADMKPGGKITYHDEDGAEHIYTVLGKATVNNTIHVDNPTFGKQYLDLNDFAGSRYHAATPAKSSSVSGGTGSTLSAEHKASVSAGVKASFAKKKIEKYQAKGYEYSGVSSSTGKHIYQDKYGNQVLLEPPAKAYFLDKEAYIANAA